MPHTISWSQKKTDACQKMAEADMLAELFIANKTCNMDISEDVKCYCGGNSFKKTFNVFHRSDCKFNK